MNSQILDDPREDGVIYCTSGEKYFNDAVISARSFKKLHPDKKVAIFTEEGTFRDEIFDYHFPIFSDQSEIDWVERYYAKQPKKWMLKVICTPKSPFRKTVHLDSDTLVVQHLDGLFNDLDDYDIIFTHLDWVAQVDGINISLKGLTVPNGINSGVYAYNNSAGALRVLGPLWREVCETEGFVQNEQAILSKFVRSPQEYLGDVRWKIEDNVRYNATRRMWRTMFEYGLWDDVRILHFNETRMLKKVFLGEISQDDLLTLHRVRECDTSSLEQIPKRDMTRLVHFHLAKTAGKSLLATMRKHLGDRAVSFNPGKQDEFRDRLRQGNWKVVSGHLSGAHSFARFRLMNRYRFFTVLRDPVDRFFSAYNYIRKTQASALYKLFNEKSPTEAATYCVENNVDYGRNSQCSGIIWDPKVEPTFSNAMNVIHERYAFVCTMEQIDALGQFLKDHDIVGSASDIPHLNVTRKMDPELRRDLDAALCDATKEDASLYRHVLENGPLVIK